MDKQELLNKGAIYFERITQGFYDYHGESLYLGQKEAAEYLRRLREENGAENSFVDFYFAYLEEESRERVLSVLNEEEQNVLQSYLQEERGLFLPLTEDLLEILTKLNDLEMLFSTFYFTKFPCTIWGNYKQEYIKFTKKME